MVRAAMVLAACSCVSVEVSFAAEGRGSAAAGAALFSGARPFRNGGPACGGCHNLAGVPFPFGGSLGPPLGASYARIGEEGMRAGLSTLFFPSMLVSFEGRPLTDQEQADLAALIREAANRPPSSAAPLLWVLAGAGALLALVAAALLWRGRRRGAGGGGVRRQLLARSLSTERSR